MRTLILVAIAAGVLAGPAEAQNIGDVGRMLQEQVLPRPGPDPRQQERDQAIYEQGRRDAARGNDQRRAGEERRRDEQRRDARRREDSDRYRRDPDRRRGDEERVRSEEERPGRGRY